MAASWSTTGTALLRQIDGVDKTAAGITCFDANDTPSKKSIFERFLAGLPLQLSDPAFGPALLPVARNGSEPERSCQLELLGVRPSRQSKDSILLWMDFES